MKVYVLSTGEYSEYTIRGIYSSKERAEDAYRLLTMYEAGCGEDPNYIDEYDLDTYSPYQKTIIYVIYNPNTDKITGPYITSNLFCLQEVIKCYDSDNYMIYFPFSTRFSNEETLKKEVHEKFAKWKIKNKEDL